MGLFQRKTGSLVGSEKLLPSLELSCDGVRKSGNGGSVYVTPPECSRPFDENEFVIPEIWGDLYIRKELQFLGNDRSEFVDKARFLAPLAVRFGARSSLQRLASRF